MFNVFVKFKLFMKFLTDFKILNFILKISKFKQMFYSKIFKFSTVYLKIIFSSTVSNKEQKSSHRKKIFFFIILFTFSFQEKA